MSLWKTESSLEIKYVLLSIQHAHNGLDDEYNISYIRTHIHNIFYIHTYTYIHTYVICTYIYKV